MPKSVTLSKEPQERELISLSDAARRFGVNEKTIRRLISSGTITGYRPLGTRLVRVDLVELNALTSVVPTGGFNRVGPDGR